MTAKAIQNWFQKETKEGRSYRLNILCWGIELLSIMYALKGFWHSPATSWGLLFLPLLFGSVWHGVNKALRFIDGLDIESAAKERLLDHLYAFLTPLPILVLLLIIFR
jgi:hypothetical protein